MPSYHDKIQELAKAIEIDRRQFYSKVSSELLIFTRMQFLYLQAAEYKLVRVELQTKDKQKAIDDLIDAYNYVALLVDDMLKGLRVAGYENGKFKFEPEVSKA